MDQNIVASLLDLNEYCLLEIFKFLELPNLVNLEKTCKKLKFIGARICAQEYKKVKVQVRKYKGMTKKEFSNALSMIGEDILSVSVDGGNQLTLQLITDKCKNLKSVELWNCKGRIDLTCFENLNELKLISVPVTTYELKTCFAKNAELEYLEYSTSNYEEDFLKLVDMFPKLHSLHLHNVPHSIHLSPHLHCLNGLTKFSLHSLENCNELLIKLAKKVKLKELQVWMPLRTDSTFDIIQSFASLEIFAMNVLGLSRSLPESIVFPPTLNILKLTGVEISRKSFLSVVKKLHSLDEFDLGFQLHLDKSLNFNDRTVSTQIEVELKAELASRKRPLKIVYYDFQSANKQLYIHCSHKLHIIDSHAAGNRLKSKLIAVASRH